MLLNGLAVRRVCPSRRPAHAVSGSHAGSYRRRTGKHRQDLAEGEAGADHAAGDGQSATALLPEEDTNGQPDRAYAADRPREEDDRAGGRHQAQFPAGHHLHGGLLNLLLRRVGTKPRQDLRGHPYPTHNPAKDREASAAQRKPQRPARVAAPAGGQRDERTRRQTRARRPRRPRRRIRSGTSHRDLRAGPLGRVRRRDHLPAVGAAYRLPCPGIINLDRLPTGRTRKLDRHGGSMLTPDRPVDNPDFTPSVRRVQYRA